MSRPYVWACKIGCVDGETHYVSDSEMRNAVRKAFKEINVSDDPADFCFSTQNAHLLEKELAVVEDRMPVEIEKDRLLKHFARLLLEMPIEEMLTSESSTVREIGIHRRSDDLNASILELYLECVLEQSPDRIVLSKK